jgi:RNA polymerase sigma-70 factor (ECF subfamily)
MESGVKSYVHLGVLPCALAASLHCVTLLAQGQGSAPSRAAAVLDSMPHAKKIDQVARSAATVVASVPTGTDAHPTHKVHVPTETDCKQRRGAKTPCGDSGLPPFLYLRQFLLSLYQILQLFNSLHTRSFLARSMLYSLCVEHLLHPVAFAVMNSSASNPLYLAGMWSATGTSEDGSSAISIHSDDESLMTLVQTGDQVALGSLLERYEHLVLDIGVRVLRDSFEAQELVQDVFLQVYRKGRLFDPKKGSFRTWLMRIASNLAFDRREYLNLHRFYDSRNLGDFAEAILSTVNIEYQTQVREGEAILRRTFEELNPKQRRTLELYFFEGFTLREISEHLNESLANTRHYYYRALAQLKISLGSQHGD